MPNPFELQLEWITATQGQPELSQTMAALNIQAGPVNLTEHKSVCSNELQAKIRVAAYPLAVWLAHSWWRLLYEPLPFNQSPSTDWRMAHELGAVNQGFVWPKIAFISDHEQVYIFAKAFNNTGEHSIRYLNGLSAPVIMTIGAFKTVLTQLITSVLERLEAQAVINTDLKQLWQAVQEEQASVESDTYRKLEAQLGYDPDEAPEILMDAVLALCHQIEITTLSELMPIYSQAVTNDADIDYLHTLIETKGITGRPNLPTVADSKSSDALLPWQQAVAAAKTMRKALANSEGKIADKVLLDLLEIKPATFESWQANAKQKNFSLAIPEEAKQTFKFLPRKTHPLAKRFELARFIGDYLYSHTTHAETHWLTNTDLSTARQKYQRAFAAEFLCPIAGLQAVLQNDFSESAIEEAATHFQVSEKTVTALLQNNHILETIADNDIFLVPTQTM